MALATEPKIDPYHCPKCGNYYYHMMAGVHFVACPDCDKGVNWDDIPEVLDPSEIPNGGITQDD